MQPAQKPLKTGLDSTDDPKLRWQRIQTRIVRISGVRFPFQQRTICQSSVFVTDVTTSGLHSVENSSKRGTPREERNGYDANHSSNSRSRIPPNVERYPGSIFGLPGESNCRFCQETWIHDRPKLPRPRQKHVLRGSLKTTLQSSAPRAIAMLVGTVVVGCCALETAFACQYCCVSA